jgi:hypothetical protein
MAIQAKINFLQDNAGTSGNALTNLTLNAGDIFWVEIQLGDFRDNASGLVGSQLDLSWTANQFDALEYKITSNFVFSLGGDLTTDGLANNLRGGAIDGQLGQRIGDNQFERFAVVRFTVESNNTTLTPTSFTIGDVAPSNFALADASGVSVIANDDALTISENSPLTGSLLGNDIIGAGGQIVAVNGNAANVGQAITLTSGATVTVNADGTFSYNAANGSAGNQDTFTYSLSVFGNSLQPTVISTTDDATVTITITAPVNEAPTITSGATATFAENDPGTVYTVTANDPNGDTLTYSLDGIDAELFEINDSTGIVTFQTAPDFETPTDNGTDNTYNITVTASDGSLSDSQAVTITVTDVNEAPTAVALTSTTTTLAENTDTVSRIKVADIEVTDDGLGTNALSLAGADSVLFEIDGTELYIKAGTNIDFETNPVLDVTVEVNDAIIGATPDASTNLAIAVTDVNEFNVTVPSDSDGTNNTVAENAANGTTVGITANATDGDGSNNTITYSLTDDAEGRFAINASTGVVTVAGALDFETATSHNITVQAASSDGSTSTETFAITVTDVDEFDVTTPVDTDTTENTLAENAALNTAVGITADAIDADGSNNTVTYSLTDNAGGRFTINTNTGVVTLAAALDFETATSHNITVQAASADGSISTETFAIDVTDVNEVPIITSDATASFTENGTGTAYTVNATDPDGDILTYSLGGIDAALFDISNTGVITFKTTPDFENATDTGKDNTYNITITANDGSLSNSQAVAIGVVNVNEAPTAVALTSTTTTLAENADTVSRIKVADIEVIDDALGTNTITLSGSDAASFEVDSNELFLQANTSLDFETKSSYAVTVNVVDNTLSGSNPVTTDFTLSITDVDDVAPVITSGQSFNYDENQTSGFVIGTVAANDNVGITRFAITANNDNGYFAIDNTGVITLTATGAAAAANDFETSPNNFTLGVTASDAAENVSFVTGVNLQVNDVEDSIQNWNLDLDGDGIVGASSDGIILIRYMVHKALPFLFAGDDLIAGAISPNATRSLADIQEYLANAEAENLLDIDGDGIVGASSDGIIAIRYMVNQTLPFLFTGDDLIAGAISSDATRSLTDIQNYMAELSSSI